MKTNITADSFLNELHKEGYASNTLSIYQRNLDEFCAHVSCKDVSRITAKNLIQFRDIVRAKPVSVRTKNLTLISVRNFIKYLNTTNINDVSPAYLALLKDKNSKKPLDLITREQLTKLLTYKQDPRIDLIVNLLYCTGLRISELLSLTTEGTTQEFEINGKGNRTRTVFIPDGVYQSLCDYRSHLKKDKGKLFTISARHVQRLLKERMEAVGIDKKVTPHTLRHLYATHVYENGADIRVVQELLGHASITTTQIYTHVNTEKMRNAYKQFHPMA